ncbi:hypothetical protein PR202_gb12162 [Eleusine coracana subsp. coracana]|uniref:RRM domain-containing protein n=1 Tax=Eleusine coracana subsp. coracana TaxID=191504 RepID=A0AAV5EPJ6_ELECO|nr:hypothetical protein QOZ80_7BG0585600 [Eleusine coracana subsp. coracana]GJN24424.1 hypothetical protein PR202_gb12162 [Eleusine coracana subsp. coracana]
MAAAAQRTAAEAVEEPRETRKLFVGGVPSAAQEADLLQYFARFGDVRSVMVMRDRETGHGRGFGFVEFEAEDAAARALGDGDTPRHYICGRQVDVKRARTRPPRNQDSQQPAEDTNISYESKKLFVGGLKDNVNEEDFKTYFEAFGTVTDAVVIYDSQTSRSRGFGFVTFDSTEAVNAVMRQSFHNLNGTKVEVKIAIPKDDQYYRNGQGRGGRPFRMRGPGCDGQMYQPYNARYGLYMPQPVPAQPFYPYFPVGAYPYGNGYSSQGVMTNVPSMMARRVPLVYGSYPQIHPGFNLASRGGFGDSATSFQNGFNGGSDSKKDQTTVDIQDVVSTTSIATKLENMKLASQ